MIPLQLSINVIIWVSGLKLGVVLSTFQKVNCNFNRSVFEVKAQSNLVFNRNQKGSRRWPTKCWNEGVIKNIKLPYFWHWTSQQLSKSIQFETKKQFYGEEGVTWVLILRLKVVIQYNKTTSHLIRLQNWSISSITTVRKEFGILCVRYIWLDMITRVCLSISHNLSIN